MTNDLVECNPTRLLKPLEVAEMLRVSIRTLRRMVAAQELPRPVHVGSHRMRWRYADLVQFIGEL